MQKHDKIRFQHIIDAIEFDINLDILWQTVSKDLPVLAAALKSAMSTVNKNHTEQ